MNRLGGAVGAVVVLWLVAILAHSGARGTQNRTPASSSMSPVLSPRQALADFDLEDGFEIGLFASEPMIEDPVAMAFDEDGRLWVVEMQSYMPDIAGDNELVPTSRVVILEDTTGDSAADTATVFLDGLVLPRAILPCYGGLLVIEPPNLLFCRDTDGDGKADEKRVVLDGFDGHINPEHAGNALRYGLDNWIHLSQFNIEFKFDGEKAMARRVPRVGQWGMTLDEQGRQYYTPNSETLRMDLLPSHYAPRSPMGLGGLYKRAGRDTTTWPSHPTRGINRGYRPGMLREDGTLTSVTAACGPALYTSVQWPEEYRFNAFVCEPSGNLVKRMNRQEKDGVPFWVNAVEGDEFLRSTDERFRPVDAQIGPDGALYICDMYRGIIQHRTYLTEYLADQIRSRGLEKPIGLGRIYRITRTGTNDAAAPRMSAMTEEQLVEQLVHPDLWWRLNAQRVLVERDAVTQADALRALLRASEDPLGRLHALWTLEGLGLASVDDVVQGLEDSDARVRSAALRVGEGVDARAIVDAMRSAVEDSDRMVRAQAALSLGELGIEPAREVLVEMLRQYDADTLVRSAAINSLTGHETEALRTLMADRSWPNTNAQRAVFVALVDGALRGSGAGEVLGLVMFLADESPLRAEAVLDRVAAYERLGTNSPRHLSLSFEPRGWSEFVLKNTRVSRRAKECDSLLSWPGRPVPEEVQLTDASRSQIAHGQRLFVYCQACHGPDGLGSGSQYPPLAGSPRVLGDPEDFARALILGLEGPIERGGVVYDDTMPPAPFADDKDLAAIMSYVRTSFGNTAGPVSAELVTGVRARYAGRMRPWRDDELEAATAEPEATPLFDGQSLNGWEQRGGGASYTVEDGMIVGETRPNQPNSFLCTTREYADFELSLEFLVDEELNSGVQIRSASSPDYRNGAVHGYQVEIDPSERAWSCGIYEESARGWLDSLEDNEPARKAFRHEDWNHMRVVATGHHIRTWINGVPAADLVDPDGALRGFIGLQVHSVGGREDPLRIRWRNIQIHELSGSEPVQD